MMAGKIEPMSERAQALDALQEKAKAVLDSYDVMSVYLPVVGRKQPDWHRDAVEVIRELLALVAPPVGVSPQPDTRRDCTCLGTCRGAEGLGPRWKCALEKSAPLSPVEPTPDAQVCVWREREWDYESGCRGTQISRDERSSGPPDGWKHCPYCGKRLVVGTAPQGGEQ